MGASKASAPILTFLDSHIECTPGWLEPLLDRIARDPTNVVCPVIDVIDTETLEYMGSSYFAVGGFDWNLQFNWHPVPEHENKRRGSEKCMLSDSLNLQFLAKIEASILGWESSINLQLSELPNKYQADNPETGSYTRTKSLPTYHDSKESIYFFLTTSLPCRSLLGSSSLTHYGWRTFQY